VELPRRTKNLRAVRDHLRHADIGTTTVYARLLPQELRGIVTVFDA
jgi:site-specific recombinase XerC